MKRTSCFLVVAAGVLCAGSECLSGSFFEPISTSGATPSGLLWSSVATGTALPIRTSATNPLNGAAGAVVYVDVNTGQIQFDPKGLSVSTFLLTYTTGTVNIGAATPGPFQYLTGTGDFSYSDISGTERTFPAKAVASSGLAPTTYASRVGLSVGPPLSASLNIGSNPNSASTNGFWNRPWAFPPDLVISGSVPAIAAAFSSGIGNNYFRTSGQAANANSNILGYGSQQGVFQYTASGITGSQLGAVIPANLAAIGIRVDTGTLTQSQAGYAVLSGTLPVLKVGAGTLVLDQFNTLTGTVMIREGTLRVGNSGTSGSLGSGPVVNNGTLAFHRSDDITITNAISGTGGLVQVGPGLLSFPGSHAYTGPTSIQAGSLVVRNGGAIASSPLVTVSPGAALFVAEGVYKVPSGQTVAGGGSIAGSMTLGAGATVAPGMGPGTLSVAGGVTLEPGGSYNWQMLSATASAGSASSWDKLEVQGSLAITATPAEPFTINLWTLAGISSDVSGSAANFSPKLNYTWKIASAAGGITGFSPGKFLINTAATNGTGSFANSLGVGTLTLAQSGNDLNLVFSSRYAGINVASGTQTQGSSGYGSFAGLRLVEKEGAGTVVFDQPGSLDGEMSVRGGVLRVESRSALASGTLSVLAGGTVAIAPGIKSSIKSLTMDTGGVVDVGVGRITVASGVTSTELVEAIAKGSFPAAFPNSSSISVISKAAVVSTSLGEPRRIGWIDNGDGSLTFGYAAPGDANVDWVVDILDISKFVGSGRFGNGRAATWGEGDFNYDGYCDVLDLAEFTSTGLYNGDFYNTTVGGVAAVPEPSTWCMGLVGLVCGGWGLVRRCRKA